MNDEKCPFGFIIHWEVSENGNPGRWYICATGANCSEHCGHLQKQADEVKKISKDIEEEENEMERDQLEINRNPAAVCELIAAKCTGTRLTTKATACIPKEEM